VSTALDAARDELARIPSDADRCIVEEWCDRYRLGFGDFEYDDAAILRLAVRLYRQGRIPQTSNAVIDWKGRPL
jgi:hypothetical protein